MAIQTQTRPNPAPTRGATGVVAGRRVIPHRGLEPLPAERRYVQPHTAHVSVFTGLIAWAIQANRRNPSKSFRVSRSVFDPDGIIAPTEAARRRVKFKNYFEFGAGKKMRLFGDNVRDVQRNRLIFVVLLALAILYSLMNLPA